MIVPSSPQEAPRSRPLVPHNETTAPPCRGIFFNFWPAKNPTHWPSGEKNGSTAPSVPASIVSADCSRRLVVSCSPPSATFGGKTKRVPSGEITGLKNSPVAERPRIASGPRSTLKRIIGRSGGSVARHSSAAEITASTDERPRSEEHTSELQS